MILFFDLMSVLSLTLESSLVACTRFLVYNIIPVGWWFCFLPPASSATICVGLTSVKICKVIGEYIKIKGLLIQTMHGRVLSHSFFRYREESDIL